MGLIEKRAIKNFQDNNYPALVNEINQAAGFEVPIEVKWDSLAKTDYAHLYDEGFTKVYFNTLAQAFKEITIDDLGKDALKETLKKVIIKNDNGYYSPGYAFSFANGELTFDHDPVTNVDDINDRVKALVKLLSSNM